MAPAGSLSVVVDKSSKERCDCEAFPPSWIKYLEILSPWRFMTFRGDAVFNQTLRVQKHKPRLFQNLVMTDESNTELSQTFHWPQVVLAKGWHQAKSVFTTVWIIFKFVVTNVTEQTNTAHSSSSASSSRTLINHCVGHHETEWTSLVSLHFWFRVSY